MVKQPVKSRRLTDYRGRHFQIRWEPEVKKAFKRLIEDYDAHLSFNAAIQKLVEYAIENHVLPGYLPKRRSQPTVITGVEKDLDALKNPYLNIPNKGIDTD